MIEIVPIREEHIDGFRAALDLVCRERKYLAFLEAPPLEAVRAFVRGNIADGCPQLVALEGERVIGWCDILPADRPVMRHCGCLGMGLLPEWRGQGLGGRLLRRALEAARDFGFSRVELTVRADNGRAIALYRKAGFEMEGRKKRAVRIDGIDHDLIAMAAFLDETERVPNAAGPRPP